MRLRPLSLFVLLTLIGLSGQLLIGCIGQDDAPAEPDYIGDIPACEVTISDEIEHVDRALMSEFPSTTTRAQQASSLPQLWQDGPLPTWNTTPRSTCPGDLTTATIGDADNVAVFVTYPAAEEPTITGDGRVAQGAWPLIVFAHANNDTTCNIYQRYRSLQRHWASWGFIVASVDNTRDNCARGTKENIERRSADQQKVVELMKALNADPDSRFFGRIATDKIVFAGHSRGGGASLLSALQSPEGVKGVITLQGIDTTSYGFGSPPLTFPMLGITAGRDVDLDYPYVEPTEDQSEGPYIWVNINGGIHAWTADTVPIEPDDTPTISMEQQHDITELYTTAFLAHFVGLLGADLDNRLSAEQILFTLQGNETVFQEISPKGVFHRWNRRAEDSVLIDDYDRTLPATNRLGGDNICENLRRCEEVFTYMPDETTQRGIYSKPRSRLLEADKTSGRFRILLGPDGIAAPPGATLQARVRGPDSFHTASFEVEVRTPSRNIRVQGNEHIGKIALENRFTQLVVPLAGLWGDEHTGPTMLTEIIIHVRDGSLFIDDLRIVPHLSEASAL